MLGSLGCDRGFFSLALNRNDARSPQNRALINESKRLFALVGKILGDFVGCSYYALGEWFHEEYVYCFCLASQPLSFP